MDKKIENLTKLILENIVEDKKALKINVVKNDETRLYLVEIKADPKDIPVIVGKKGSIIKAIRNIIKIPALQNSYFVELHILE